MSSYTGLFVHRLENGTIHGVQVKDSFGMSLSLDPGVYIARQITPPIGELPDINNFQPNISPIILMLSEFRKGVKLTEVALYTLHNSGFIIDKEGAGQLQLTPQGERALREHGLY